MMQRKNKVRPTPITTIEDDAVLLSSSPSKPSSSSTSSSALLRKNSDQINPNSETPKNSTASKKKAAVVHATVKRNTWGTQPFDKHWLNLDCCGLVCASLTYMLHAYGVYSFGWILLPPWFSVMDEDGYRELTFGCIFHRTLFITIAALAVFAHFKAMTTDPGAVPPDANPLPDLEELECLIKGEERSPRVSSNSNNMGAQSRKMNNNSSGSGSSGGNNGSSLMMQDEMQQQNQQLQQQQQQQNGNSLSSVSQATATVAIGAAAVVVGGVAGAVATVATSAAPQKPSSSSSSSSPPPPAPQSSSSSPPPQQRHVHGPNCNHNNNNNALPPRGRRMCRRCNSFKPPRAHHCSICNRCIIKMDHHCPWVNNCVGIGNHKYFLLFIFYTSLSCGYSLTFLIWRFCHCTGGGRNGPRCVDHPTDLLPLIGLTVEALLFGLFTMCMMCDQWDVVMTNLTHIDRLKGHDTLQHRVQAGINEVFGTGRLSSSALPHYNGNAAAAATNNYRRGFHYTWLSPLHKVCFPESVRDDIFGYCRPVNGGGGGRSRRQSGGIELSGLSGGGADIV